MKKQVFYIHGGESFSVYEDFLRRLREKEIRDLPSAEPFSKWTKNFAEELGDEFEVFMPAMPNKENAKYEEWKIWFERHFAYLHDDVIFIGCSLGAMFLAKYASEKDFPVKVRALLLMATAVSPIDDELDDSGDFLPQLDFAHFLAKRAEHVAVLHSKDDFLVPFSHGEKLHAAIPGSEFIVFEDKNHFLVEELPELVKYVKQLAG